MPAKAGIHRLEASGIFSNHFKMDTGSEAGMTGFWGTYANLSLPMIIPGLIRNSLAKYSIQLIGKGFPITLV